MLIIATGLHNNNKRMDDLKLQPGQIYYVKVTEFRPRNKTITKQDQQQYELHYVKVQDDAGKSVLCEFACLLGKCKPDTFVVGVKQYIRCGILSGKGTPEIEPSDEPGSAKKDQPPGVNNPEPQNAYGVKIAGTAMTFAMGFAKDLKVAEIERQDFGYKVTDQDLDDVVKWAERINLALTERITF